MIEGMGLAIAGLVLGYLSIATLAFWTIFFVLLGASSQAPTLRVFEESPSARCRPRARRPRRPCRFLRAGERSPRRARRHRVGGLFASRYVEYER
jgi:hypothetical protein